VKVEYVGRLRHRCGKRGATCRRQRIYRCHDAISSIDAWPQCKADIALIPGTGSVGNQSNTPKARDARQNFAERQPYLIDAAHLAGVAT